MAKRLNDTAALTAGQTNGAGSSHHISSRKIDNGFVISESRCDPNTGQYTSSERFSESEPRIIPGRVARGGNPDAGSSLAETKRYLGEDV